jgi:DNA-binding MarR family transcriptional regulator
MNSERQWLDLGLQGLSPARAQRVRLFRLLVVSSNALRGQLERKLAAHGITVQQSALLQWIEAQPQPPTISAVAAGLGMTHQNVKQIAAALERKGFVEIAVDEHDRRARRLVLTAHHRRFWGRRNPDDFAQIEAWTKELSDEEVAATNALLARLYRHLRELDGGAQRPQNHPEPRVTLRNPQARTPNDR